MSKLARTSMFGTSAALVLLCGCATWQVVPLSPHLLADSSHWTKVQVREAGGTPYLLTSPRVIGDSVRGTATRVIKGSRTSGQASRVVTETKVIPLANIDQVAVRRGDPTTAVGVSLLSAAVLGVLVAINGGPMGSGW